MAAPLLLRLLTHPQTLNAFSVNDWDTIIRQAASSNLTASVGFRLEDAELLRHVPSQFARHFAWSQVLARRHREGVRHEMALIQVTLTRAAVQSVVLKGAAYVLSDCPVSRGRIFSDIDIMVPKSDLDIVEAELMMDGWASGHHDPYDQRYYRRWMHELPPMEHTRRLTLIDVHHAILPQTARSFPNPEKLRAAAHPLPGWIGLSVLAPVDMILHSAVHLFNGEFDNGLRDLVDIDGLMRHYASAPGFWDLLPIRANELELSRPLFYAVRYATSMLHTPVPPETRALVNEGRPKRFVLALMDGLLTRALMPPHRSCTDSFTGAARFMLYVRANWLRMPPLLLARHLFRKAIISRKSE